MRSENIDAALGELTRILNAAGFEAGGDRYNYRVCGFPLSVEQHGNSAVTIGSWVSEKKFYGNKQGSPNVNNMAAFILTAWLPAERQRAVKRAIKRDNIILAGQLQLDFPGYHINGDEDGITIVLTKMDERQARSVLSTLRAARADGSSDVT